MKKYRFLELNSGKVVIQTRILFFFWVDTYRYTFHDERYTFDNLEAAKRRLQSDLEKENSQKVKKIHD